MLIDTFPLSVSDAHPPCGDPVCVFCASRIVGVPEWQLRLWAYDETGGPEIVNDRMGRWEPRYERVTLSSWLAERGAAIAELERAAIERERLHVFDAGPPFDVTALVAEDRAKAEAEWAQTLQRSKPPEHQPYIARRLWRITDRMPSVRRARPIHAQDR